MRLFYGHGTALAGYTLNHETFLGRFDTHAEAIVWLFGVLREKYSGQSYNGKMVEVPPDTIRAAARDLGMWDGDDANGEEGR